MCNHSVDGPSAATGDVPRSMEYLKALNQVELRFLIQRLNKSMDLQHCRQVGQENASWLQRFCRVTHCLPWLWYIQNYPVEFLVIDTVVEVGGTDDQVFSIGYSCMDILDSLFDRIRMYLVREDLACWADGPEKSHCHRSGTKTRFKDCGAWEYVSGDKDCTYILRIDDLGHPARLHNELGKSWAQG